MTRSLISWPHVSRTYVAGSQIPWRTIWLLSALPIPLVVFLHRRAQGPGTRRAAFLFSEPGGHFMSWVRLSRSLRVFAITTLCGASSVASLRADPIVVTSGRFATSTNEPTGFQFFGADGFFLGGIFPLVPTWPSLVCSTFTGCAA